MGVITISFDQGIAQIGEYIITRQGDGQVFSGPLPGQPVFDVEVPHGDYLVEVVFQTTCSIPDPTIYTIAQKFEVVFSVPSDLTACGSFVFVPTPDNLDYTITNSSGIDVPRDTNGEFTLTQSDTYTVRGEDPAGIDCPKEKTIVANITQPIVFDISPPIVDCQVGIQYEAILNNADPADVIFLWKDELGVIVGRRQIFVPSRSG